jgi:hypothetical protein
MKKERISVWTAGAKIALALSWLPSCAVIDNLDGNSGDYRGHA